MATRARPHLLIALAAALALLTAACGGADDDAAASPGLQPSERYVHVQLTEQDARRNLDQDPFPQATLEAWPEYFGEDGRGGAAGYYLFMSEEDEWRIGSYIFLPQEMTFIQGDRVTMELFGIRGDQHDVVLEGPGLESQTVTVNRGELHTLEFTVDEPGHYQLICTTHPPTQTANIHVLPAGI
jgi:plastocyanin